MGVESMAAQEMGLQREVGGGPVVTDQVPQPHHPVAGGTEERAAVGAEGDAVHLVGVPQRRGHRLTGGDLPDPRRRVAAACGDEAAVGAEGGAPCPHTGERGRLVAASRSRAVPLAPAVTT